MANGKRYFWLKFKEDFFQDLRIKKLRKLAGGDTFTIIYLKMMLLALKNDGYLYFDGVFNTFSEELAEAIDESIDNVTIVFDFLIRQKLAILSEDGAACYLTEMSTCIGSETASAQRVRDFRERKKQQDLLQCNTDVTPKALQCNTDVTELKRVGSVEKEIEIDKDIYKKKNIKKKKAAAFVPPSLEEVREYCEERKNSVNPEAFIAFYESKGWRVGRNKMTNWKQAVITWEIRQKEEALSAPTQRAAPRNFVNIPSTYTQQDFEELERRCLDN